MDVTLPPSAVFPGRRGSAINRDDTEFQQVESVCSGDSDHRDRFASVSTDEEEDDGPFSQLDSERAPV